MILHITKELDWSAAESSGLYRADSLAAEGFIHCSTLKQVLDTANTLFRGQDGLVLLCIEPEHVVAPILFEDCYESGQLFPHIYGPLNVDAVSAVLPFSADVHGRFYLPDELVAPG